MRRCPGGDSWRGPRGEGHGCEVSRARRGWAGSERGRGRRGRPKPAVVRAPTNCADGSLRVRVPPRAQAATAARRNISMAAGWWRRTPRRSTATARMPCPTIRSVRMAPRRYEADRSRSAPMRTMTESGARATTSQNAADPRRGSPCVPPEAVLVDKRFFLLHRERRAMRATAATSSSPAKRLYRSADICLASPGSGATSQEAAQS